MIEVLQTSALPLGYAARILTLYKLEINLSGRRDSNPRPPPWQGDILPLNYFRKMMAGLLGFEPTHAGATIRCVHRFTTTAVNENMAGVVGLEPTPTVLETVVLPIELYPYTFKWWRGRDSNSRTLRERIYSPSRLATSLPLHS